MRAVSLRTPVSFIDERNGKDGRSSRKQCNMPMGGSPSSRKSITPGYGALENAKFTQEAGGAGVCIAVPRLFQLPESDLLRYFDRTSDLIMQLSFNGINWIGIVNRDDRRSVDLLASLPTVDPKRIGCLGLSGGAFRSTYLAGMDSRIRAAVITGWMSTLPSTGHIPYSTHSDMYDAFGLHSVLNHPDVATLGAPECAILVQKCKRDRLFTGGWHGAGRRQDPKRLRQRGPSRTIPGGILRRAP